MATSPDFILSAFNPPPIAVDPGAEARIGWLATVSGNALLVALAGAPVVVIVDLDLANDEVAIGGPDRAGTRRLGLWVNDPNFSLHRQVTAPGSPQVVRTDKDVDYIGAQATNVSANANLVGLQANRGRIRSVTIISDQQLAWEIALYSSDTFRNANLDLDTYLESVRFAEGDGFQDDGAGSFRYAVTGLDIPYFDADATLELHQSLINRSVAAKAAGAAGEIVVQVTIEPSE